MSNEVLPSMTVPLPTEAIAKRGWRLSIDGAQVADVRHVTLSHPDFGRVTYGLTPAGHDGWTYREATGGGAVVLPYCKSSEQLLVGVVQQHRPLQGGWVLNAPRGFADRGELPAEVGRRELVEEMGLDVPLDALELLPGRPANPNSTFFETGADRGVCFFAVRLQPSQLHRSDGGWTLAPGVVRDDATARNSRLTERIRGMRLVPWFEAACLSDMFTNAAVARLLAMLG